MSRRLGAVLLLAVLARTGAFLWSADSPLGHWDELEYYATSSALAEGRQVLTEDRRQPGVIRYLVPFFRCFGASVSVARLAGVLPSCLSVWLLFVLGRRYGGERVGLFAAGFAAVDPDLVFYSVSVLSEPLYLALSLGALALIPVEPPARIGRCAAAGAAAGLAALTREVGVVLPAAGIVWILAAGGRGRRRAALAIAGGFLVCVAPWSAHLNRDRGDGAFAFLTRTTWFNLYLGNVELPARGHATDITRGMRAYRALGDTAAERESAAKGLALRAVAERMPWWPLEKLAEVLPQLAGPASLPARRLLKRPARSGHAGTRELPYRLATDGTGVEGIRDFVGVSAAVAWMLALVAGTAGLVLSWRRAPARLFVLFVAAHGLASVATFAIPRFRIPLVPIFLAGAAWLLVHGRRSWREAGWRPRAAALASGLAAACLVALQWRSVMEAAGG